MTASDKPLPKYFTVPCCKCLAEGNHIDISTGNSNASWFATPPLSSALIPVVVTLPTHANWATLTFPGPSASWVDDTGTGGGPIGKQAGLWIYQMQILVQSKCRIPYIKMPSVTGKFRGDNSATISVNGNPQGATTGGSLGFPLGNEGSFSASLIYGLNTIRVEVKNDGDGPNRTGQQSGVIVNAFIQANCDASALAPSGPPPTVISN